MSKVIVICGKGGVGKTTLAALFSRLILEEKGIRALVIDADPAGGLCLALNLPVKKTVNDLRKEIVIKARSSPNEVHNLAAAIDYRLLESLSEYRNLALLSIGRPEEEGCFCQVNSFLRQSIEFLSDKFDLTIVDSEAGVEQVNRRVVSAVDNLLLVSDRSKKGLHAAAVLYEVASELITVKDHGLIINRVRFQQEYDDACEMIKLPVLGWLPEDEVVDHYDRDGNSFLNLPECASLQAARKIIRAIF